MTVRIVMAFMLLLGLSGCMSVPVSASQAEAIPPGDLTLGTGTALSQGPGFTSEVTIVRDAGGTTFGIAKPLYIEVDGAQVALFNEPGTKAIFFVPEGLHTVSVGTLYSGTLRFTASAEITAKSGFNTILKIGGSPAANEPPRIFVDGVLPI